jgi:hypothetical protein
MKVLKTLSRLFVNDLNLALEFYEKLIGTHVDGSEIEYVEHSKAVEK